MVQFQYGCWIAKVSCETRKANRSSWLGAIMACKASKAGTSSKTGLMATGDEIEQNGEALKQKHNVGSYSDIGSIMMDWKLGSISQLWTTLDIIAQTNMT